MNKNSQNKSNFVFKPDLKKTQIIHKRSKSLDKAQINDINKNNKYQNKTKLRQNINIQNLYYNNNNNDNKSRGNSKSDPYPTLHKIFSSINAETTSYPNISKPKNKLKYKNNFVKQSKNFVNNFKSDINNKNFFKTNENIIKLNFKKISKKTGMPELLLKDTTNFENLKYIPLNDISSLFNAWQNSSVIYRAFEEKILKKNDFEIDKKTLGIKTKNAQASKELNNQRFWILYIEYLIEKNLLLNEKQFLSVISEAFSYMNEKEKYPFQQLKKYYLEKIKKYSPSYLPNGDFDDNDETYINKLDKSIISYINYNNVIDKKYIISNNEDSLNGYKKYINKINEKSNKNNIFEESDTTIELN